MTNLAEQRDMVVEAQRFLTKAKEEPVKKRVRRTAKSIALSNEDRVIVTELNTVKHELKCLHNRYDNITNELLVESLIYEIKAANKKYEYYLSLCKEKGIINAVV